MLNIQKLMWRLWSSTTSEIQDNLLILHELLFITEIFFTLMERAFSDFNLWRLMFFVTIQLVYTSFCSLPTATNTQETFLVTLKQKNCLKILKTCFLGTTDVGFFSKGLKIFFHNRFLVPDLGWRELLFWLCCWVWRGDLVFSTSASRH